MEADLQNLRPALGELNGDRSDRPYGELEAEDREYGDCDFEVRGSLAEPNEGIRGDAARTYLYFERVWNMRLTSDERALYDDWSTHDPPDAWGIERDRRIAQVQGVGNPFVGGGTPGLTIVPSSCVLRDDCCRVCAASQACGDACISRTATYRRPPGCACSVAMVCE